MGWPETHFGFGIFEIQQNLENRNISVTVHGWKDNHQPVRQTDGHHSDQLTSHALEMACLKN